MATTDFLPSREAELLTWSTNFKTRILLAPLPIGLSVIQATAYGALHDSFVTAYNAATNDGTNSRSAIVSKNAAKILLIANARLLAGIVQKFPGTSNTQRSELGLTVRDAEPTPIPPPATAPTLSIVSTIGNTVRIRLKDPANPSRRGRPSGVDGAAIFTFVGAVAPTEEADWTFQGNTARTSINITFPGSTPAGAKVWFTAFWFNPRKQSGPPAIALGINLPGGAAMAA